MIECRLMLKSSGEAFSKINLKPKKTEAQKKAKLMCLSLISQRPGLQPIPDFPAPLLPTHTAPGLEIASPCPEAEFTRAS